MTTIKEKEVEALSIIVPATFLGIKDIFYPENSIATRATLAVSWFKRETPPHIFSHYRKMAPLLCEKKRTAKACGGLRKSSNSNIKYQ